MSNRADDEACTRLFHTAWALWRALPAEPRSVPPIGSFVVVIDGCVRGGHPRNAVGTLVAYRPPSVTGRARRELFTLRTPRGVVVRWTNCVLFEVPEATS